MTGPSDLLGRIERETGLRPPPRVGSASGVWLLKADVPEERPLSDHLLRLDETVRPYLAFFRDLAASGATVEVLCGYRTDCDHCGFEIAPEALALVGDLGARLGVSVIVA